MGRAFTGIVSAMFVALGIWIGADGDPTGWWAAGFFGACLLVAILDPWLPKPWLEPEYRLVWSEDEIACEHPRRAREVVRWQDVQRIWYLTYSAGPYVPDEWVLLETERSGCSFPTEAKGISDLWKELEQRYPGFDFGPVIRGGTVDAKHLCWERERPARREA